MLVKRFLDIALSLTALVALPIMVAVLGITITTVVMVHSLNNTAVLWLNSL